MFKTNPKGDNKMKVERGSRGSRLVAKQDKERYEELDIQAYDRHRREDRLLKRLSNAIRKRDDKTIRSLARRICAMHAWKWGMDEKAYLKAHPA